MTKKPPRKRTTVAPKRAAPRPRTFIQKLQANPIKTAGSAATALLAIGAFIYFWLDHDWPRPAINYEVEDKFARSMEQAKHSLEVGTRARIDALSFVKRTDEKTLLDLGIKLDLLKQNGQPVPPELTDQISRINAEVRSADDRIQKMIKTLNGSAQE